MNLRWAKVKDVDRLAALDRHLSPGQLAQAVEQGRVLTAWDGQVLAGWLRYGWFWDNTPFLNLLSKKSTGDRAGETCCCGAGKRR